MRSFEYILSQLRLSNFYWVKSEVCRYGVIVNSTSWDTETGSHRILEVHYLDHRFNFKMQNGEVLKIEVIG